MTTLRSPNRSERRFISFIVACAALFLSHCAILAAEPDYLSTTWFHRGPNLNLLTTASGYRVAVDNDGQHIADESLTPDDRNIKLALDALHEHQGEFYLGRDLGNHGYDWFKIGKRGQFLTGEQILKQQLWRTPLFRTVGFHFDNDPMRGDSGMTLFPDAGLVITCGQTQWDSRGFSLRSMRREGYDPAGKVQDRIELPIYSGTGGSVRSEDLPDRVFIDPTGDGFWFLGTTNTNGAARQLALAYVKPRKQADGKPKLEMAIQMPLGEFNRYQFEAGVAIGDSLYLLIAVKDPSIGGVKADRRLLQIDRAKGLLNEKKIRFEVYLDDVHLAAVGKDVAVYAQKDLRVLDGHTFKQVRSLLGTADEAQLIYRVVGNPKGDKMAVGLATAYRRAGENTRVLIFDLAPGGKPYETYHLKPGSIDDLIFTEDGGVLVFADDYTAKLGGTTDIKAHEAASITKAKKAMAKDAAPTHIAPAGPHRYLDTPLAQRHKVWFDKPTKGFGSASLPLGNGHLGAMFDGGTKRENIVLNVDSMWAGSESRMASYQGFGQINVDINHDWSLVRNYRRELDLRTGIYTVTYDYKGIAYKREAFCSYPHGLLAIRFSADKPGAYSGAIELMAMHPATFKKSAEGIEFAGELQNKRKFKAVMKVKIDGGKVLPEAGKDGVREFSYRRYTASQPYNAVRIEDAQSFTLYFAADTDYSLDPADHFRGDDPSTKIAPHLAHIEKQSFNEMAKVSAADVSALFDRCTLELATHNPKAEELPIDQRKRAYSGTSDPGLETLVFDAQRYMMIACSRPGTLPANLQGIWNDSNWPAWTCDYHTDINVQMNYWFCEPANLSECVTPLFDYIESQRPIWIRKAKQTFGDSVRGWTVAYMNNIDGGMAYKNFPPGSAWLAWHYAEHFKFSQDQDYLQHRAYPILKELSEHWQDLLIERPNGQLVTPRTMSPEHKPMQYGISQDVQIVHNLFTDFLAASKRLATDEKFRKTVADMRDRLIPIKIGRWGQIQEWERDRDSRYCAHRHIQHLFAAFPGSQICSNRTPELAEAAVTSLEARGRGRTGWSQVWRMNIFARLGRSDLFYRQLRTALPSFHDHLIWQSKNQIDAPCGYASGICEALLQSHETLDDSDSQFIIDLLPALPDAWPTGRVIGLRARGGFAVDIEWKSGQLLQAKVRNVASVDEKCVIRYKGDTVQLKIARGNTGIYPAK